LWRAVDQHGTVLDILVTSRRDAKSATRFFRNLFKGLEYVPRVLVTDSWAATKRRGAGLPARSSTASRSIE
jgi:putative transposase